MAETDLTKLDDAIRRRYDADSSILQTIEGCVVPTIRVDDSLDTDLKLLAGRYRYGGSVNFNPGGGLVAIAGLRNPFGSGVIGTVRSITTEIPAASEAQLRLVRDNGALPGTNVGPVEAAPMDSRAIGQASSSLIVDQRTHNALIPDGKLLEQASIATAPYKWLAPPIVVTPGFYLHIHVNAAAHILISSFVWEERAYHEEELLAV